MTEVFSSPGNARLVHRFGLTPGEAFDLRTGWDLNDPAHVPLLNIQKCGHIAQGLFFAHQQSGNLPQNAEIAK